jgi:Uma2 family endonuclease
MATIPASPPGGITAEEFFDLARRGAFGERRAELTNGELEFLMGTFQPHDLALSFLTQALAVLNGDGWRVAGPVGVWLDEHTVRDPDLALFFVTGERRPLRADEIRLAVEVSDATARKDLTVKRWEYAAAGVRFYWVVDLDDRRVVVHEDPSDGDYRSVRSLHEDEPLPGTDVTPARIWAEIQ